MTINLKDIVVVRTKDDLILSRLARGQTHHILVQLSENALGVPWRVPLIVVRGKEKGPVFGITAALHGDELNGLSTIFKLVKKLDPSKLAGTLVLVPISNVPGYIANQRFFSDNVDLNRIMPGRLDRNASDIYAYYFIQKIVSKFHYLLDLHTASVGRINSLYLRADLEDEACKNLAALQNAQIIVKKYDEKGTLRGWANDHGIPAITIEIGNSNSFQHELIDETLDGILNTLRYFKMIKGKYWNKSQEATICEHSYWIYSDQGGVVDVLPNVTDMVSKGEVIANIYDVFGQIKKQVKTELPGIVIGKNVRPNCNSGTRLLHLGVNIQSKDFLSNG